MNYEQVVRDLLGQGIRTKPLLHTLQLVGSVAVYGQGEDHDFAAYAASIPMPFNPLAPAAYEAGRVDADNLHPELQQLGFQAVSSGNYEGDHLVYEMYAEDGRKINLMVYYDSAAYRRTISAHLLVKWLVGRYAIPQSDKAFRVAVHAFLRDGTALP